jgi:hypothetical protein
MNSTSQKLRSCVAIQTSSATSQNSATHNATINYETGRKPASIKELRAQLRAQQGRNQYATENSEVAGEVAHDSESCAEKGWGFEMRNCATQADGDFTPWHPPVSIELVYELHRLIAEYAKQFRLADDATQRLIETAKRQSAASVPASVEWFKREIGAKQ